MKKTNYNILKNQMITKGKLNILKRLLNFGNVILILLLFTSSLITAQKVTQQLNFSTKDVTISKSNNYDVIELSNYGVLEGEENAGSPQLPVVSFDILLPKGAVATGVTITSSNEKNIAGSYNIHPVQMPHYPNFDDPPAFENPNSSIYNSNETFPQVNVLEFTNNGYRDYNYVRVSFIPFKYTPEEKKLNLLTNVVFDISYTVNSVPEAHKLRPFSTSDKEAYLQIQKMVTNPSQLKDLYPNATSKSNQFNGFSASITDQQLPSTSLPSLEGGEVKYVIITNNTDINGNSVGNFVNKFQEFADWKTQTGNPARIVTVDDIRNTYPGVDVPEKIRNFIKEAHQLWGTEYVLLGGGASIIPVRWIKHSFDMPTDLYYSAIYHPTSGYDDNWNGDGDDIFGENSNNGVGPDFADYNADIAVGRAPVETNSEVDNFLKKNFAYARCSFAQNIPNGAWLGKQLMGYGSAFDTNWNSSNAMKVGYEIIQNHHQDIDIYGMFEYHAPRDLPCDDPATWGPAYYPLHNNDCTTNNVPIDDENLLKADFLNQINSGYGMINILEHGGPYGLGLGKVTQATPIVPTDFQNLTDTHKYGVLLAGGCHSAAIERDFYIGEQWVNSAGGGVAYMGASADIWASSSYNFNREYFDVLHDENVHKLGKTPGVTSMNLNQTYLTKIFQILGDPDLSIYTDVPSNMNVTHSLSIPVGNQDFDVNVTSFPSGELVRVCLYKEDEVLAYVETDIFPVTFDITPDTEGLMRVTATCHNAEPYEANVNVYQNSGVHLYRSDMTIIDENGNGFIEPGEIINLQIELSNTGATNATGINGNLTTSNSNTIISQANSGYPNIASGQSGISIINYTFTASTQPYPGNVIPFELLINSAQGTFTEPFILNTRSAQLEMGNRSVLVNGNETNTFNANDVASLFIDVKNVGNILAENVTAVLTTSLSPSIASLGIGNSVYGDIDVLETITNGSSFTVNIGPDYFGEDLPFELTLTDEFGKTDVFTFDLTDDYPPKIIWFEYTASNDFITPTWNTFTGISGYNIYRSDTEVGGYEQLNDLMITSAAMYNDLEVMPLTGYWYKVSVVSLSGNELSIENLDPYYANTTLGYHGGFPIQSHPVGQLKTIASPTVYDVDGDGNKEIFLNLRTNSTSNEFQGRILGFYESGQEMFDIDGNQTNVRGFAETEEGLYANSAVGDIDGDGNAEVFAIARFASIVYGYHSVDSNDDQQPDPLWDNGEITIGHRTFRNPVLSDLNNNGFMEIIIIDEKQRVSVFDHNKNLLGVKQIGNEDYSTGELAIVDTDGDGYKEIIIPCEKVDGNGAIYIWKHNGNFNTNPTLLRSFPGKRADGGPVVADIDGDGAYEILTIVKEGTTGYLYALNIEDGSSVNSNWAGTTTMSLPNAQYQGHIIPRIAVGDLNNDGVLEAVFGSVNSLFAVNSQGNLLPGFPIPIATSWDNSPILADIDGDNDVEIIINEDGELHAYNYTGDACFGWPLLTTNEYGFIGSPFIGDIDSDGLNEVVIGSEDFTAHVWDTPGSSDKVEWESYRENAQNTAVYKEECMYNSEQSIIIEEQEVSWLEDKHINGNLIIKANSELTIYSTVTFTSNSKVVVEQGGKLILNGATLTTKCNGLWKGVIVKGNSGLPQTGANQGTIVTENNSRIEYAETAIYAASPSKATTTPPSGGAIVHIKNTTFKDNIVGINMPSYKYSNSSFMKGNLFETTDYLTNRNYAPNAFLIFGDVGKILVKDNMFKNHKPIDPFTNLEILPEQGKGIVGIGSELIIEINTFENLHVAIDFEGEKSSYIKPYNKIDSNTFDKNWLSVRLVKIYGVIIISNTVNVFATYLDGEGANGSCGLHITKSNGFHIEENDFSSSTGKFSTGIYIVDCSAINEIYRNWYSGLYYGIFAEGKNRVETEDGLEIICNKFSKNKTDIYVAPKSEIAKYQGDKKIPAGNVFYPECEESNKEFNNQSSLIYYFAQNEAEYIPECNNNLEIGYINEKNKCLSTLDEIDFVSDDDGVKSIKNEDLHTARNSNEAELKNLILEVAPNPARGYFMVKCSAENINLEESILQISNSNGIVVKKIKVDRPVIEVPTELWTPGIYLVTLINNQEVVKTERVIVY